MAAAPSMAAAIAASLPAPTAAPAQAAPSYETIPPSMAKLIDIEADIVVNSVQLDGMVSAHALREPRLSLHLRARSRPCFRLACSAEPRAHHLLNSVSFPVQIATGRRQNH